MKDQYESRMHRLGQPPVVVEILEMDDGSLDAAIERTLRDKKRIARELRRKESSFTRGLLYGLVISIPLWIFIFFVLGWHPW